MVPNILEQCAQNHDFITKNAFSELLDIKNRFSMKKYIGYDGAARCQAIYYNNRKCYITYNFTESVTQILVQCIQIHVVICSELQD